jgi:hypothetical protein
VGAKVKAEKEKEKVAAKRLLAREHQQLQKDHLQQVSAERDAAKRKLEKATGEKDAKDASL